MKSGTHLTAHCAELGPAERGRGTNGEKRPAPPPALEPLEFSGHASKRKDNGEVTESINYLKACFPRIATQK